MNRFEPTNLYKSTRRNFLKVALCASTSFLIGDSITSAAYSAEKNFHNPIFPAIAADPEVLFSQKTGRVYIYPTGNLPGAKEPGFTVWSSDNLVDWQCEGYVLRKSDIHWENCKFWAPSILERKGDDGVYRYYFYYCANEKIGVAVGEDPVGPFVDVGEIIGHDLRPQGRGGVEIDPFVFADPVSGKTYLYWGNSYLCVAELDASLTAIKKETIRDITPENFFEGTYVFYRNGQYYLTWSKNPTWDPNYEVWCATSNSPLGPFTRQEKTPVILSKGPEKNILGPGHHSFLFLPNGENYIFYHRLVVPHKDQSYSRQVCLDRFEFATDGSIMPIEPTHEGISKPVDLKSLASSLQ